MKGKCNVIFIDSNSHTRSDEVLQVKTWAANNNLQLSCSKLHEIVFRSRRLCGKTDQLAPPSPDIKHVGKLTILGIVVNNNLTATDHVSSLLSSCSRLLYALRVLRYHELGDQSLKDVFHATVIGKLMYCAPARHGFCSEANNARLESFIRRCVKMGYVERSTTVTGNFLEADDVLFHRILYNKAHVLHTFLPDRPLVSYSFRSRTHNKNLSFAKPVTWMNVTLSLGLCLKTYGLSLTLVHFIFLLIIWMFFFI